MNEIQRRSVGHGLSPRDARRVSRGVGHIQASSELATMKVDSETDLAITKVLSETDVVATALGAATRLSQLQSSLELIAPAASARLNMLADAHALGLMELQSDYLRRMRRI